jgi:predicted TIM-barrel fold metal-dependent hydrolase|tara:strand:- start:645 stop:1154 length:510 start_codon:yes stop_codon:yes gene_type:complete
MTDEVGVAMFELCGERRAPVGFMCFHGLHLHVEDIKELMRASPRTPVMIDHFGFCKGVDDPNWKALLELAKFPQVGVKASAQFRVLPLDASDEDKEWPYPTTGAQLRQLIDAFGVERVLWGSDFPYVTRECGYAEAATILENCGAGVTPEEKALLMGGNLQRTFPGGWY